MLVQSRNQLKQRRYIALGQILTRQNKILSEELFNCNSFSNQFTHRGTIVEILPDPLGRQSTKWWHSKNIFSPPLATKIKISQISIILLSTTPPEAISRIHRKTKAWATEHSKAKKGTTTTTHKESRIQSEPREHDDKKHTTPNPKHEDLRTPNESYIQNTPPYLEQRTHKRM